MFTLFDPFLSLIKPTNLTVGQHGGIVADSLRSNFWRFVGNRASRQALPDVICGSLISQQTRRGSAFFSKPRPLA
jgi:hypothetical protein